MTEVPASDTDTAATDTTATVAARRRNSKAAKVSPVDTATVGTAPAAVAGQTPVAVLASRTTVSEFHEGGPARPVGSVWAGRPLVLATSPVGVAGVAPGSDAYVTAACDASESVVAPGCVTPTSRLLWRRGMLVRRDLYERVLAEHAARAAQGTATVAPAAALPDGADAVPVDALTPAAVAVEA